MVCGTEGDYLEGYEETCKRKEGDVPLTDWIRYGSVIKKKKAIGDVL